MTPLPEDPRRSGDEFQIVYFSCFLPYLVTRTSLRCNVVLTFSCPSHLKPMVLKCFWDNDLRKSRSWDPPWGGSVERPSSGGESLRRPPDRPKQQKSNIRFGAKTYQPKLHFMFLPFWMVGGSSERPSSGGGSLIRPPPGGVQGATFLVGPMSTI